ncbi:MAG: 4Fe-4S binding protein [Nitrospirota bacterium]
MACSSSYVGYSEECTGCGACYISCPYEAIEMKERPKMREVKVEVNGRSLSVPEKMTVRHVLEFLGY